MNITATPKRGGSGSGSGGKGKLMRVSIEFKANGFEITKSYEPKMDRRKGYPIYEPETTKDSVVFNTPGDALTYLEKCLGSREHKAHERKEMAGKY